MEIVHRYYERCSRFTVNQSTERLLHSCSLSHNAAPHKGALRDDTKKGCVAERKRKKIMKYHIQGDSPLNLIQVQVQSDWIILITRPCMEARMVGGPVDTRRDTR